MQITLTQDSFLNIPCDVLIVPIFKEETANPVLMEIDQALDGHVSKILSQIATCTDFGQTVPVYTFGKIKANNILLAGMGQVDELSLDKIRSISAITMRRVRQLNCSSIASIFLNEVFDKMFTLESVIQTVVEGAILGTYEFNYYKTKPQDKKPIKTICFFAKDSDRNAILLERARKGEIIANSVNNARNLVNHPSCYTTPSQMAQYAEELAKQYDLDCQVLDRNQMQEEKMHALLAVAKGSNEPPKMIILTYKGDPESSECIALIGKGITFDSGGISIKPAQGMGEMKDDMAGGASVLGTMEAIGQLRPKANIIAIVPCTENMPSGTALKPGDVIFSQKGTTIEIISTDAEGRLILADAVNHAIKLGATKIVDLATLTGACVIALGSAASGVLTNNEEWWGKLKAASLATGEKMWQLPAFEEYKEQIKSDIADLKNTGGRPAGTITAGLFIAHFAAETPWIHIDIAGTANSEKETGYNVKGATGVGVRTLVELIQRLATEHGI